MSKEHGKSVDQFEKEFDSTEEGKSHIHALKKTISLYAGRKPIVVEMPRKTDQIRFGVFGDTQFGSLYERIDALASYYKQAVAEGITTFLHTGDVLEGWKVYKGQEFELHARGWKEQKEWFEKKAPKYPGVTTYFITGNHDHSLKKIAGIDVGEELSHVRPDWKFLGEDQGRIVLKTASGRKWEVMLLHPGGGSAYSLSYRPQKIIESLEGGTKPNMICIGHFHKAEMLPSYRNIVGVQSGAFQGQTPFMATKGLSAAVGGWIFEINVGSKKSLSNRVKGEFIAYY